MTDKRLAEIEDVLYEAARNENEDAEQMLAELLAEVRRLREELEHGDQARLRLLAKIGELQEENERLRANICEYEGRCADACDCGAPCGLGWSHTDLKACVCKDCKEMQVGEVETL